MTLREYAKLMNDTALQGSLSNEEYNRLYKPLLDGIQSMIPPMLFRYRSCNELSLQALWDDKIWLSKGNVMNDDYDALLYPIYQIPPWADARPAHIPAPAGANILKVTNHTSEPTSSPFSSR